MTGRQVAPKHSEVAGHQRCTAAPDVLGFNVQAESGQLHGRFTATHLLIKATSALVELFLALHFLAEPNSSQPPALLTQTSLFFARPLSF